MKKILTSIIVLLFVTALQAQKIDYDEINPFNKRVILTNWEKVNWTSTDHKLQVGLMFEGADMSMLLNWQCQEMVGAERDSEVVLLFDDTTKVVLHSKAFSVSGSGKITSHAVPSTTMGIQIDAKGDFGALMEKKLQSITINTTSGQIVFPVSTDESIALQKLYEVIDTQFYKSKKKDTKSKKKE